MKNKKILFKKKNYLEGLRQHVRQEELSVNTLEDQGPGYDSRSRISKHHTPNLTNNFAINSSAFSSTLTRNNRGITRRLLSARTTNWVFSVDPTGVKYKAPAPSTSLPSTTALPGGGNSSTL
uniref:Uncharacterized protein n=1 Tax=Glossina pallidipes TaxID=7398 RepID=A0A1A9ZH56_GLOPL